MKKATGACLDATVLSVSGATGASLTSRSYGRSFHGDDLRPPFNGMLTPPRACLGPLFPSTTKSSPKAMWEPGPGAPIRGRRTRLGRNSISAAGIPGTQWRCHGRKPLATSPLGVVEHVFTIPEPRPPRVVHSL